MKVRWMLVALLTMALLPTMANAYPRPAASAALASAAALPQDHDWEHHDWEHDQRFQGRSPGYGRASATAPTMAAEIAMPVANFTSVLAGSIRIAATVLSSATSTPTNTSIGTATKTATRKATTDLGRRSHEEPSPDSRPGWRFRRLLPALSVDHYLFCHWPRGRNDRLSNPLQPLPRSNFLVERLPAK